MTCAQFAAALAREPEHVRKIGRPILKNLAILESDADDETKAAVLRILPANVKRFEAARNR